jgi:hypothetical protein
MDSASQAKDPKVDLIPVIDAAIVGNPAFISVFNDLEEHAAYALTAPWQASNRCANSGFIWQGTVTSQSSPVTDNGVPPPNLPVKHAHRKPGIGSRLPTLGKSLVSPGGCAK